MKKNQLVILEDNIYAYCAYMTKFMPADSKKFERVDEIPNHGNVPKAEDNDRHCYDLETDKDVDKMGDNTTYNIYYDHLVPMKELAEIVPEDMKPYLVTGRRNRATALTNSRCRCQGGSYWRQRDGHGEKQEYFVRRTVAHSRLSASCFLNSRVTDAFITCHIDKSPSYIKLVLNTYTIASFLISNLLFSVTNQSPPRECSRRSPHNTRWPFNRTSGQSMRIGRASSTVQILH